MADPKIRAKASAALRAMGHKPPIQGGNGRALPEPQRLLLEALGGEWQAEFRQGVPQELRLEFSTGVRNYAIDIANCSQKIAVEADGATHNSPKARETDARKTAILSRLGWTVLRFSNQEILADLAGVGTRCRALCLTSK